MPIFDFTCKQCGHRFEALVRRGEEPACTSCKSKDVQREMPLPAVQSEATHSLAMRAAKKRDSKQATERVQEQIRYERSHND